MKLCAEFPEQTSALTAHRALVDGGVEPQSIEIRSSYPLTEEAIPPHRTRPFKMRRNVKMCWFLGGLTGFLTVSMAQLDWPLYTSGHQIVPIPIDMIPTYESAMITGLITTVIFFFIETKPFRQISPHPAEDLPVARGSIALIVEGDGEVEKAKKLLDGKGARTIVTYAMLFCLGLSMLTGCEVRMRNQPSIKSTQVGDSGVTAKGEQLNSLAPNAQPQVAQIDQVPGTVTMPTREEQAVGPQPVFGYYNWPDIQRLEDANAKVIPKEVIGLKNPVPADTASVNRGKDIYTNQCSFCHGATGHGEGKVGEVFTPRPPALAESATAALSDGAMFWKITVGPNTMPPFATRLTARDRFDVINYIRSLQKEGGAKS